jgi:hypothetical protein
VEVVFNPNNSGFGETQKVAIQPDGKTLIATSFGSSSSIIIQRLTISGTIDSTFPTTNLGSFIPFTRQGLAIRSLADGRVMVATTKPLGGITIRRFTSAGLTDPTFRAYTNPIIDVRAVALTADGRTWFSGFFNNLNGVRRNEIARLDADGSIDSSFNPGFGMGIIRLPPAVVAYSVAPARFILPLEDGRAIVLGDFTSINGDRRPQVARLNAQSPGGPNAPVVIALDSYYREVRGNEPFTVQVTASGSGPLTYNGLAPGFTTSAISFPGIASSNSSALSVSATNSDGFSPLNSGAQFFYLRVVPSPPVIATQPSPVQTNTGRPVSLSVSVFGNSSSYQWFKNGNAVTNATGSSLNFQSPTLSDSGNYTVVIRNSLGIATSETVRLGVDETPRFVSIATRALAGRTDAPLIAGFAVQGPGDKRVLVRGVGPSLANPPFNLTGVLADPVLTVYNSAGTAIYTNDDWGSAADFPGVETAATRLGAFPLAKPSADAAGILNLAPSNYTVVVTGKNGATGVALAEVYEDDNQSSRLLGLSSRAFVGTGAAVTIPGIVVRGGGAPKKILIRAVGPGLAPFNVANVLADPVLTINDGAGTSLATNDNWESSANIADLIAATAKTTFPLAPGSRDAAILVTLPTGGYTVLVSGVAGASGNALVEIYELP